MSLLSRLRKWFTRHTSHTVQVPVFSIELLDPLPSHEAWQQLLNTEALRRSNGNKRQAAKLIGRSESYLRKVGK